MENRLEITEQDLHRYGTSMEVNTLQQQQAIIAYTNNLEDIAIAEQIILEIACTINKRIDNINGNK